MAFPNEPNPSECRWRLPRRRRAGATARVDRTGIEDVRAGRTVEASKVIETLRSPAASGEGRALGGGRSPGRSHWGKRRSAQSSTGQRARGTAVPAARGEDRDEVFLNRSLQDPDVV